MLSFNVKNTVMHDLKRDFVTPFSLYILPFTCMGTMHAFLSYPSPCIPMSAIFYTSHHLFSHYTTPFLPIKSFMSMPMFPLCPSHTHHAHILTHPSHASTYLTHFSPFHFIHYLQPTSLPCIRTLGTPLYPFFSLTIFPFLPNSQNLFILLPFILHIQTTQSPSTMARK